MEKVLILGATGYIGRRLVHELESKKGLEVLEASRSSGEIEVDITDSDQVKQLPEADIVVNAAGEGEIDGLETDRNEWDEVNVQGVKNLAAKYSDTYFIHLSSLAAMGLRGSYSHDMNPEPVLPYSCSKLESEKAVRESFHNCLILRLPEVFDVSKPPELLEVCSKVGFIPSNGKKTLAIERSKLAEKLVEIVKEKPEGTRIIAEEYYPGELAEEAGLSGFRLPVPKTMVHLWGLLGEFVREIGVRVPGKARAESINLDKAMGQ